MPDLEVPPLFPDLPVLAALVVDDPFWRYPSDALAGEGIAHLRVWSCSSPTVGGHLIAHQGTHLAVVSETGLGASVTNSIEGIWSALSTRFVGPLVLLEHWPASQDMTQEEHLDQVIIDGDGRAQWRRVWPTPLDNPQHQQFTAWMTSYGYALLAASRSGPPTTPGTGSPGPT